MPKNVKKITTIFMYLVMLHSLLIGLLLIFLPVNLIELFGFPYHPDNFFRAQGGIFHIVMCYAYLFAGIDPIRYIHFLRFSYIAKFIGVVFLILYFLSAQKYLIVFLSGIGDFFMGIIIFLLYRQLKKNRN